MRANSTATYLEEVPELQRGVRARPIEQRAQLVHERHGAVCGVRVHAVLVGPAGEEVTGGQHGVLRPDLDAGEHLDS